MKKRLRKTAGIAAQAVKQRPKASWNLLQFADVESWRVNHGLSQQALCRMAKISHGSYRNWKLERYAPTAATQKRLASLVAGSPPPDPKNSLSRDALKQAAKQREIKQETNEDPPVLDVSVEIASITGCVEIIKTYIQTQTLSPDELVNLTARLQQSLLGDI